jgi:phosphonate transport system ATP-binding protein
MSDTGTPTQLFQLSKQNLAWQGKPVLHDLEIEIKVGEKVALLGKSGAGKSTLLKALYQLRPDDIAFCQQAPALVPNLSLFHNIYMGQLDQHNFLYNALNLFFPQKKAREKVASLAQSLGLQDHLKARAETLSGGQQQRAALARTLIQEKAIFLGDEPVSAVDELQAERLIAKIISVHESVVLALHNTELAVKYCDRIIGLKDGELALDCQVADLDPEKLRRIYSDFDTQQPTGENSTMPAAKYAGLKLCR